MKDFIFKNYIWLYIILFVSFIVISYFLVKDKKFMSESYVGISTAFIIISGLIAGFSFYTLHTGSSEKAKLSKEETENLIVNSIDSAFTKTIQEQEKGLGKITKNLKNVNDLVIEAESSLVGLGKSAEKIESVTSNITNKLIYSEIFIKARAKFPPIEIFDYDKVQTIIEKSIGNIFMNIGIEAIEAKYSASNEKYERLNPGDSGVLNGNSYYYASETILSEGFKGSISINHKLLLKQLNGKFEDLKIGDSINVTTNIILEDETISIVFYSNKFIECKIILSELWNGDDASVKYYTLEITKINYLNQ